MHSRLLQYSRELEVRALWLAEEAATWSPVDLVQYPAETGAYDRELRRRQVLLWKCAVDAGAILLHAAVLRALDGLPRIVTRILQLRAELRAAIDSGELPHNYRLEVASRSCDYFLVQMFEETCRLGRHRTSVGSRGTAPRATRQTCLCE